MERNLDVENRQVARFKDRIIEFITRLTVPSKVYHEMTLIAGRPVPTTWHF